MKLKFFSPLFGCVFGILLASELFHGLSFGLISIGVSLAIWLIIYVASKDPVKGFKFAPLNSIWIFILFAGIGALDFEFRCENFVEKNIENQIIKISGLIKEVKYQTNGDKFIVKVNSLKDHDGNSINYRNLNILLRTDGYVGCIGDIINFESKIESFSSDESTFDYQEKMRHQGINYFTSVKSQNIIKSGTSSSLTNFSYKLRENLIIKIDNSSLNSVTGNFLISILLGDKTFLSTDTRQTLSSAGLAHILALSGMHVAIVLSIILTLLFPLSLWGFARLRKVVAISLVWIYILISGGSPATVRAGIMASFVILAFILERRNTSLNALLAASLFIILLNPFDLWNIGFQLSFICVASIILFTSHLNPIKQHKHPKLFNLVNLILVTLITSICTWVTVAYYFHVIPLLFLPANLLLLPLLPLIVFAGLSYLTLLMIGIDCHLLANLLEWLHDAFIYSADFLSISGSSNLYISVPSYSVFLWILGIIGIVFFLYANKKIYKKIVMALSCTAFVFSITFLLSNLHEITNSSLRFSHSFTKIEASWKQSGHTTNVEFPRNDISNTVLGETKIFAIDAPLKENFNYSWLDEEENNNKYLLVGAGSKVDQVAEIINQNHFEQIILHAGIGKNKKMELLELVEESLWSKIYSLRENGSLEFDL